MHHVHKTNFKLLAAGFACFLPISLSHASGFRIPELSITGIATSNTLVANTEDLGALPYNPAAGAFHDGKHVQAGLIGISYETTYTAPNGNSTKGQGKDFFEVPNFILSVNDDSNIGFSFLVNAPFGLETNWPDETFPGFDNTIFTPPPPRRALTYDIFEPQLSRIKMLNYNPNITFKLDDNTSMAVGIDFYDVIDLSFNTNYVKMSGSGDGVGYNVGMMHKMGKLNLGISYRSAVSTSIRGFFDARGLGSTVVSAQAKLKFPSIMQIGMSYQFSDNFGMEFDIDHTGWKSFGTIVIQDSTGTPLTSTTNNWENSTAYRLGFNYKISPDFKLMFGYSYDNSPQPDAHFSARVPDADRQLFSIGGQNKFGDWTVEYAYLYADVDSREVNSNTTSTGEPNGTNLYNGTYESDVSLIGLSFATKF